MTHPANISRKGTIVINVWSQTSRTMSYSSMIRQWLQRTTKQSGPGGSLKGRPRRLWDSAAQKGLPIFAMAYP